jgi:hypothetical protein
VSRRRLVPGLTIPALAATQAQIYGSGDTPELAAPARHPQQASPARRPK